MKEGKRLKNIFKITKLFELLDKSLQLELKLIIECIVSKSLSMSLLVTPNENHNIMTMHT